jgi:hypothetical protein
VLKLHAPERAKRGWLEKTAERFRQGVQLGFDYALSARTSNRGKIHAATYASTRNLDLPSDCCRMAVNGALQLTRSHFGLRKAGKPSLVRATTIGLRTNAYKVVGTTLRVSTGKKGEYLWFPFPCPRSMGRRLSVLIKGKGLKRPPS